MCQIDRIKQAKGLSLVELLIGLVIMGLVMGSVFTLASQSHHSALLFAKEPQASDIVTTVFKNIERTMLYLNEDNHVCLKARVDCYDPSQIPITTLFPQYHQASYSNIKVSIEKSTYTIDADVFDKWHLGLLLSPGDMWWFNKIMKKPSRNEHESN